MLPATVKVKAGEPAAMLAGSREAIVGAALTVKLEAVDAPPSGLTTFTLMGSAAVIEEPGTAA